ncbi:hypothetical protein ACIA49_07105 [Kribbella sp. NPDC051587]|uniref:hypothetical protein n=1 Tax=Kribbella sp. NPDC051587 TaxID=3364119 RepID=UPI0037AECF72
MNENYSRRYGYGLTSVDLSEMRARFRAVVQAPELPELHQAAVLSSCDVPRLIAEVERVAMRYADLVAACRAGIFFAIENGDADWLGSWQFVLDELPPAPVSHPMSCRPPSSEGGDD